MNRISSALLAISTLALATLPQQTASAQTRSSGVSPLRIANMISLTCANPGSHQDVSKTPIITNNSGAVIPAGTNILWRSSDGDRGSIKLQAPLAVGAAVEGLGHAGQSYTCTSSFNAGLPDLVPAGVSYPTSTSVSVGVKNTNAWVDAGSSKVHVEIRSCSGSTVLLSGDSSAIAVPRGQTKVVTIPLPGAVPGNSYVFFKVDSTSAVAESSETNNIGDGIGVCIH